MTTEVLHCMGFFPARLWRGSVQNDSGFCCAGDSSLPAVGEPARRTGGTSFKMTVI